MRARLSFISLSAPIRSPVSSRVATLMSVVRSPAATWRAAFTACCNGRTIPRVTSQPSNMPMATPSTASVIISARMRSYRSVPACTDTAAAFSLLTARSVIRSSSFCDETTTRFYFLDGRIGLGQRLRLGRAEEVLGLALPGVLDLDELGQQTLAFVGLKVWPARSRSLSMVCTASSNCLRSALRSCSLVAARYPVRARPA